MMMTNDWMRELEYSRTSGLWFEINGVGAGELLDFILAKDAEIERLREALKTFANNVKETNEGIDENWAKTVYPLKAENQRLREESKVNWVAFQKAADEIVRLREALESFLCECETEDDCCAIGGSFCGWVARAALKGDE